MFIKLTLISTQCIYNRVRASNMFLLILYHINEKRYLPKIQQLPKIGRSIYLRKKAGKDYSPPEIIICILYVCLPNSRTLFIE